MIEVSQSFAARREASIFAQFGVTSAGWIYVRATAQRRVADERVSSALVPTLNLLRRRYRPRLNHHHLFRVQVLFNRAIDLL